MKIEYLVSAPKGDIPVGPDELMRPFLITLSEPHPFLTLGDYFEAINDFILKDHGKPLISLLSKRLNKSISLDNIHEILIRSEKHGALYHLASVEIFIDRQSIRLAVNTAISEKGKAWLAHELDMVSLLDKTFGLPYLPKPYFKGEVERHDGTRKESLSMLLAEWFDDYHEWHLSMGEKEKNQQICIWDIRNGYRLASKEEGFQIFKQASKILTLFYDTQAYSQIYPWHHAAGDFVVRNRDGTVDVKLTTARNYGPVMLFLSEDSINPMASIIYFFLNLTLRIRLDKLDGVGEVVWAEEFSVRAATEGFFEALRVMEAGGRYQLGKVEDLLCLLKAFSQGELQKLFHTLLDLYQQEDPGDLSVIQAHLEGHVRQVYLIIQGLHL